MLRPKGVSTRLENSRSPWYSGAGMNTRRTISDTSAAAEATRLAIYARMEPWRKVELVDDAIRTSRHLAMIGLRSRHPHDAPAVLRRRLLGLVLGEEMAGRVYGPFDSAS